MHSSRLADLFEDFCRPPSSHNANSATTTSANTTNSTTAGGSAANTGDPSTTHLPGHFLPFEEIHLPPHLQPLNPEDEDDVVPDMHAAFGITRALGQNGVPVEGQAGGQREPAWRDLGLERLVDGGPLGGGGAATPSVGAGGGVRRTGEGRKPGRLAMMR